METGVGGLQSVILTGQSFYTRAEGGAIVSSGVCKQRAAAGVVAVNDKGMTSEDTSYSSYPHPNPFIKGMTRTQATAATPTPTPLSRA